MMTCKNLFELNFEIKPAISRFQASQVDAHSRWSRRILWFKKKEFLETSGNDRQPEITRFKKISASQIPIKLRSLVIGSQVVNCFQKILTRLVNELKIHLHRNIVGNSIKIPRHRYEMTQQDKSA